MKISFKILTIIIFSICNIGYGKLDDDLFLIKEQSGCKFNYHKYLQAKSGGATNQNKDMAFSETDWFTDNGLIGYLPILGRIPKYGVNIIYLGKTLKELDFDKIYIVPLLPNYSQYFVNLIKKDKLLDQALALEYTFLIFNSDPGSSDNNGYYYANSNKYDSSQFTDLSNRSIIESISKTMSGKQIMDAFSQYKNQIRDHDPKKDQAYTNSQTAIYLIPKIYCS